MIHFAVTTKDRCLQLCKCVSMTSMYSRYGTVGPSDLTNTPDVFMEADVIYFFSQVHLFINVFVFACPASHGNKRSNTLQCDTSLPLERASPQR